MAVEPWPNRQGSVCFIPSKLTSASLDVQCGSRQVSSGGSYNVRAMFDNTQVRTVDMSDW